MAERRDLSVVDKEEGPKCWGTPTQMQVHVRRACQRPGSASHAAASIGRVSIMAKEERDKQNPPVARCELAIVMHPTQ